MKKKIIVILISLFFSSVVTAQREAVNWYFGHNVAIDFNSGSPVVLNNGSLYTKWGSASSYSDSLGNTLIYSNGDSVWNGEHNLIPNATGIGTDDNSTVLIIPDPGSTTCYYLFTVGNRDNPVGLHYSKIDLSLNGGQGGVVFKDQPVQGALGAQYFLTAAKHANRIDWWIVVRRLNDDKYVSYHLTPSGLNTIPQFSSARNVTLVGSNFGQMKFSPDNTILAASFFRMYTADACNGVEISKFDNVTGKLRYQFTLKENIALNYGVEFSPDGKFLYVNNIWINNTQSGGIFQYEISHFDSLPVPSSGTQINIATSNDLSDLQLAADGKIYASSGGYPFEYMSVINDPWKKGTDCNFADSAVWLEGRNYAQNTINAPQEYLYRFVWEGGLCAGVPFHFKHRFIPEPDSINWNFGDPGSGSANESIIPNPAHKFSQGGIFEVSVRVVYPGGRIEETSRKVRVLDAPEPDLGPDKLICNATDIQLDAGGDFNRYNWNGSITPGTRYFIASDTGTYWVKVLNDFGCFGADSINVYYYQQPVLNTDSLVISPTTCGGSRGAITGLTATGVDPINVEWRDGYNNFIAAGYDLINMPVGNYYLWSTDGNGCTNLLGQYYIRDAGEVLIDTVKSTPSYCGSNNGTITITAVSGLGQKLQYSVNDGGNWSNDSIFTNLSPAMPYFIRVRVIDTTGCQAVFEFNPVTIADLPGPEVTATSEPETDNNADGTITITATGFGTLIYKLENGTPQDSGVFTGLEAGLYHYRVEDENGCFVEDSIRVEHLQGFILSAIAGNDTICSTQTLHIPVMVDNFNGIRSFKAVMNYDAQKVTCHGYMAGSINNQLTEISIIDFPAIQEIVITWLGGNSVTLQGMEQLFTLVFTPNEIGISDLTWDQAPGKSYFEGENGLIDNVQLVPGQMQVNDPADVSIGYEPAVCEGDMLIIAPVFSGTAPMEYQWQKPDGGTDTRDMIFQPFAGEEHSGVYRIKVTDALGCSDSAVITARVIPPPTTNFPETPIPFENHYTLEAPQGYASYDWSNGETNYFITVTEEGEYSVLIKTTEGCESRDTAMLVNVTVPVYVPNAFTPNGDGLNDTFKPIIIKPDLISQYHLSIYNRWGQCFFETSDPAEGWDGKDELPGVYNWLVSYMDGLGKVNQLKGVVTLIK